ncbi:hypothetical protein D3C87_1132990 [compost metagenome]
MAVPGEGRTPETLQILTMEPPFGWACICRHAACATCRGAIRFSATMASLKRGEAVAASAMGEPPALLTTMSSRPWRPTIPSTKART